MTPPESIPTDRGGLARWIRSLRDETRRRPLSPEQAAGWLCEEEPDRAGGRERYLTVFLTNRECPWSCLMCDLWQGTLLEPVPPGALVRQVTTVLGAAGDDRFDGLKLYNAGSFFDVGAVPRADWPALAALGRRFGRVVVENHPRLTDRRVLAFRDALAPTRLELALGLETADAAVLERLNKGFTLDHFVGAAEFLADSGIDLRVFVLVQPPGVVDPVRAVDGACRAVDFAFDHGARVVSVIPTRPGNGAMEELARRGLHAPPARATVEAVLAHAWSGRRGTVLVDTWDLGRAVADAGDPAILAREWEAMNRAQSIRPPDGE